MSGRLFIISCWAVVMLFGFPLLAQETNNPESSASQSQEVSANVAGSGEEQSPDQAQPSDLPMAPTPEPSEVKFSYNPQGTRDPFLSLIERQEDLRTRPKGIAGMSISEISLQGIQIGLGKVAIFKGTDNKAYPLREGESVFDGKLVDISGNKAVFEKIILDPFGREKEKQKIEVYLHRE